MTGEDNVTIESEITMMWPQPRNASSHQKLEQAWIRFCPRTFTERMNLPTLDFGLMASKIVREKISTS